MLSFTADAAAVRLDAGRVPAAVPKARDARIDVLRGLALLTIFVDHVPPNVLNWYTLHNYSLSDAAEVFVFLAGASCMMAYGPIFGREGAAAGARRVAARCLRIYAVQVGLFLAMVGAGWIWRQTGHDAVITGRVQDAGWTGILRGLLLDALPTYLDILPLYVVLLGLFPVIYLAARLSPWLALGVSGTAWLLANLHPELNLPNMLSAEGWYFNPFAWQFLFTIGAVSVPLLRRSPPEPFLRWRCLRALCWAYLAFGCLQAIDWPQWGLPNLAPLGIGQPSKTLLSPLRLLSIVCFVTLAFGSPAVKRLSERPFARPFAACGRHSLEVFAAGCLLALASRALFIQLGAGWPLQAAVNLAGVGGTIAFAMVLDRPRGTRCRPAAEGLAA